MLCCVLCVVCCVLWVNDVLKGLLEHLGQCAKTLVANVQKHLQNITICCTDARLARIWGDGGVETVTLEGLGQCVVCYVVCCVLCVVCCVLCIVCCVLCVVCCVLCCGTHAQHPLAELTKDTQCCELMISTHWVNSQRALSVVNS